MQNVLLCIQTGKTLSDPNAMRFETEEFYVKSADEMAALFKGHEEVSALPLLLRSAVMLNSSSAI